MRLFIALFCTLICTFPMNAQVLIGNGSSINTGTPIEPYYGYTYSQQIYLSSEINASGSITGVKFYATPSTTLANSSSWTIYVGHTTKTDFTSTTDWVPVAGLTQVFSGTVTIVGGVVNITFTIPFAYNGTDNLLIAVDENLAGYDNTGDDFYATPVAGNRSITYYSDPTNPDPATPPTASGLRLSVPNIEIQGITQACPTPSALTIGNLTSTSAELNWTENGTATSWQIEYGAQGFSQGAGIYAIANAKPYPVSGLSANTDYDYYVRAICGPGDSSNWAGPYNFYTGYCVPAPTSVDGQGITNISMDTINNTTAAETNNYGDFSAQIANSNQGSTLAIDISLNTGFGYTYDLWAWVDWNGDLDFDDPGEEYFLGTAPAVSVTTFNASIAIPMSATLGDHRIRIGGADSGLGTISPSDPCYSGSYAAFEDYTLRVMPALPPALVISEIMYNPAEAGTDSTEFIEIYNNDTVAVDLANYTLTGGIYTFPSYSLAAGAYYLVAINTAAFNNVYGFAANGQFSSGLSNAGESIVLKMPSGTVVDSVFYDDVSPWPFGSAAGAPDGGGASLVLCDVNADNNDGANWAAATTPVGVTINGFAVLANPGAASACATDDVTPSLSAVDTAYCHVSAIAGLFIVTNNSSAAVSNVPYTIMANGTTIAAGSIPSIAGLASDTIPIGPLPAVTGVATIVAYTSLSSDIDMSNDTVSMVIYISNTTASASVSNAIACNAGNNGAATASGTDGIGTFSYLWDAAAANQTTATATGLIAGVYNVTVTDSTGCADMASVTLTEPSTPISVVVDSSFSATCNGSSNGAINITVSGGIAGYSFFWSNGSTSEDVMGLAAGAYTVTVYDANSCSMVTGPISVNEPTSLSVNGIFPTDASCNGSSDGAIDVTVNGGTPGYNFAWSNGATTEDLTGIPAGTYAATISDANNCTTILSPFPINEPTAISVVVDASSNVSCNGDADGSIMISVSAGAGAPYSFMWSNGATTEDLTGLTAAAYSGTITDANGCSVVAGPVNISEPTAIVVSTVNNGNGTATASASGGLAPYSFVWSTGDTTATISSVGLQFVTVTDASGCTAVDSIDIIVGVSNLANSSSMNMYPNPSSGNVFVSFELSAAADVQIQIINMAGQVVLTQSFSNVQNDKVELMTAELPTGIYIVHAILGQERIARKLVVTGP